MSEEREASVEWLAHATPEMVAPQLREALEEAGFRTVTVFSDEGDFYYGEQNGEQAQAGIYLRPAPHSRTQIVVQPRNFRRPIPSAQLGRFSELARSKFSRVGIAVEDMLAPEYRSPDPGSLGHLAVTKPSERSMWVDPIFRERDIPVRDDLCFVLMPFSDELTSFYISAVKPVLEDMGFECRRADDITGGQTDIIEDIWYSLNEARFVIVDLTDRNPNVYYELGIAHTLGKRVIAIHRSVADHEAGRLPFDVQSRRTIFYDDTARGADAFKDALRKHVQTIIGSKA